MKLLTPHFSVEEMLHSKTADDLGFTEQYQLTPDLEDNLKVLCEKVLEPLRAEAIRVYKTNDVAIIISSGYRCPRVNHAVGGEDTSQHQKGEAADTNLLVNGKLIPVEEWYQLIKHSTIGVDQLIQEFDRWAHISYSRRHALRNQCLRATKDATGKAVYTNDNK